MNNDIVVKQPPKSATVAAVESAVTPEQEKPSTDSPAEASKQSNKPVGVMVAAIIIAMCLVTIAVYIGYNQSQSI